MRLRFMLTTIILTAVILAGCASSPTTPVGGLTPRQSAAQTLPTSPAPADTASLDTAQPGLPMREDQQGAVTIKVTPLNLEDPGATLDFDIVLDTHSVDLSMDVTQLATLRADTGVEVKASAWPAGSGHHYEATLSFPAQSADGRVLLEGAKKITLVITDLDAPERVFEWDLIR